MIDENLIIVCGCNNCSELDDFIFNKKNKVIGIDANKYCYENLLDKYKSLDNFIFINKTIYTDDDNIVKFYINESQNYIWSSLDKNITNRIIYYNDISKTIQTEVETITINKIIETYGCPIYLKIYIEGADHIVLESLLNTNYRPKFISCETECLGENYKDNYLEYDGLGNIKLLHQLGYTKFLLLKNEPGKDLIFDYEEINNYNFVDFKSICRKLMFLRRKHDFENYFDFWYDVVATN